MSTHCRSLSKFHAALIVWLQFTIILATLPLLNCQLRAYQLLFGRKKILFQLRNGNTPGENRNLSLACIKRGRKYTDIARWSRHRKEEITIKKTKKCPEYISHNQKFGTYT